MEIRYRSRFRKEYSKLPKDVQKRAEDIVKIFAKNPFDSRLKTHKLHGPLADFYACAVNFKHRIIFAFVDKKTVEFYSIGDHDIYE